MEWIKVTDQLPLFRERVLVSNGKDIAISRRVNAGITWIWSVSASNDKVPQRDVTHWMHLPNLPKLTVDNIGDDGEEHF